jgi:pimeloyl-ACP methyl ester carboxylesterase
LADVDEPRGHLRCGDKINVPTLIVSGELDRVDTTEALRTELMPRIPHAKLHLLPDVGHLSPLEAPIR